MSVIAWDGNIIAADRQGTHAGLITTNTKLYQLDNRTVVGFVGSKSEGLALIEWYKAGAKPADHPKFDNAEGFTYLIVVKDKQCFIYESQPYALKVEDAFLAWGAGRDFAIAAMHLGKNAIGAVEVASIFNDSCGNGVTYFEVGMADNGRNE
ncbi:MAG: hypothetical protein CTY35_03520 [Methylotenera sp.]|nr:MAG: hypothetical protein CTY35_03520 [Methylotenera sp.]